MLALMWEANLKTTKKNFELLTHAKMINFIEKGIIGWMKRVFLYYAEEYNKYMAY